MKSAEFKKILKPLIKQAVKEVILEEGILSNIVSEVARGLQGNLVVESSKPRPNDLRKKEEEYEKQRQERIRRLNESTQMNTDIFSGTRPIPEVSHGPRTPRATATDAGVDIADIEKLANGKWKHLI